MQTKWFDRTKRFVANRLSTETYIGLHLTVTFIVAVAAIWLCSALLEAVLDNATLVRLDVAAAEWIHASRDADRDDAVAPDLGDRIANDHGRDRA